MADESYRDDLEKTEEPTSKRRDEARRKGQFAKSKNLVPAATLLAIAVALRFGGEELMLRMERCIVGFFAAAGNLKQFGANDLLEIALQAGWLLLPVLLPFFGGVVLAALGSGFLQTGFVFASEPLHFDPERVNPFAGLRRLFSLDAAAELLKATIFIAGLGFLGFVFLYSDIPALISLSGLRVEDIVTYATHKGAMLSAWAVAVMGALAIMDYLYQRWRTDAQLRMSRQEIKEEMREQEGDPHLKSHVRSLRQKLSRRRMTAEVVKADVIITNPTELAVAMRYRVGEMSAPRVLGKGAGYIAQRIREIARERGIPVVENKPLAQLLYRKVDVGREIPETLYRAVAEVLAYVYRLRRGDGSPRSQLNALQP
jgi:flagellar biosynthetic protein FlhB